jgi:ABC-2 type transport system permease protein
MENQPYFNVRDRRSCHARRGQQSAMRRTAGLLMHLLRKEFLQICRNSFLPRLIAVFPVMMMCVMPWVMNMEVKDVRVDVVDNDRSSASQRCVHRIEQSPYFRFNGQPGSYAEAMRDVAAGRADLVLVVPRHAGRDAACGRQPRLLIAANAVNGTKGSLGASYLSQTVAGAMQVEQRSPAGSGLFAPLYLYNKNLNYKLYMIPALMTILVILFCGFLPALNIVGEKETGTIEQINVTPVGKGVFILSKLIPYWIIGLVVMSVCFVLSWLIYGITCQGNILWMYLLALLLIFTISGLGLIVSNYNDTLQQAMLVMWFIIVCLILLSGLFTPVASMPRWAQWLTVLNPCRWFIDGVRTVFIRGGGFSSFLPQTCALTLFAVVMDCWAVVSYKKRG